MKKTILSLLLMVFCLTAFAQTRTLKGTVVDGDQLPLPGVSVVVKGSTTGTTTDFQGVFELKGNDLDSKVLLFTLIGFVMQEKVIEKSNTFNIVMFEDNALLDELVVVGYGVQKKKLLTGATSQVKGDDIQRQNTVSAVDALKSTTSGVQIVKSSGQPGSKFNINIRGLGTTGNASPLILVDGMPVSDIDFLNPSDIESTDILKDAASAAIYGSRAANGVILITTKKGSFKSKSTLSYDSYIGFQNIYKTLPVLNAREYGVIMNEGRINDGLDPYDYGSLVPRWGDIESGKWNGTNWLDEITVKNAPIQNHSFAINGGSEASTYSVGFSYTSQEGILGKPVASNYDRYNARFNGEQIIIKHNGLNLLKTGQSVVYSYSEQSGIAVGDIYWNSVRNMLLASPFVPVRNNDGDYHYSIDWDKREPNPIALMEYTQGMNMNKSHNLLANAYAEIEPLKNLKIKSSFGYTYNSGSSRSYVPAYNLSSITLNTDNQVSHSMWGGIDKLLENTINYRFNLDKHHFDVLGGNSIQNSSIGESISGSNVNSIFNDLNHAYLDNTKQIIAAKTRLSSSPYGEQKLLSYFGRINYDYNETYLLTLVMRADGSSNFGPGHRWGTFPSVAIGWVATNESFMAGTSQWLDFLKLRASWGQNGNQSVSPFQYLSLISIHESADYFGADKSTALTGAYPSVLPNPDVSWETSEQINFGLDTRFFKDRLDFTFDLYRKTTKDWLIDAPVLASNGISSQLINGGDVQNKGIEVGLKWRDNIGKVNYSVGANLSHNKNKVTRIANTEKIIHGATEILGEGMSELYRAEEGMPIGYFWGYKTDGIFQNEAEVLAYRNSSGELIQPNAQPGDVRFVNRNDDDKISDDDKTMIGDPNPDYTFGLNLAADYKGFYCAVTGNGVSGNQIARSYRTPDKQRGNYTTEIFGRWHGEGTSERLPRVSQTTHINTQYVSDLFIESGDYFRISNMTIGYDFKTLFKSKLISQLKVYASIQNAYTFTKYSGMDPEIGYSGGGFGSGIDLGFYPSPRTVMFGTSIKF